MAKKKKKTEAPAPECKAILLCEKVIIDHLEGRFSIVGIIDEITTYSIQILPHAQHVVPDKLARWRLNRLLSRLYTGEMKVVQPPKMQYRSGH